MTEGGASNRGKKRAYRWYPLGDSGEVAATTMDENDGGAVMRGWFGLDEEILVSLAALREFWG